MALPKHFHNYQEYFDECLSFFREYQYLYNFPNTDILVNNILDKIVLESEDITDIFKENYDLSTHEDDFFRAFFTKLKRLQVVYSTFEDKSLEVNINAPLGPKKKHEIIYLAEEIKEICDNAECDVVVDFGSGLGYLDQHIFNTTNYRVLGIECSENNYVAAKKRQRKYHEESIADVKYIKHTINENSHDNIQNYVQDKFENHRQFCITGLHACADLTIDAINIFLKMNDAKALVIMPCCYHKMVEADNGSNFRNFPQSKCLRDVFEKHIARDFIKVPFLRLGAQPPCGNGKLDVLVFNLLSRAVLQLYAHRHNCKLKRNKRKAVKTKIMDSDFSAYIHDATNGFKIMKNEPSHLEYKEEIPTFDVEELLTLWKEMYPLTHKKAGIFILLQNYLQPVIENIILYDKLVYLEENGIKYCRLKKIFDEKLSPRCIALLASK